MMTDRPWSVKRGQARLAALLACFMSGVIGGVATHAAEIVGPEPPLKTEAGTRVKQGDPPLVKLTLRGDDGQPLQGRIVRWDGPIGEGLIAEECGGVLHVSTAVPGTYEFIAVLVPASVTGQEDIEIIRHPFVIEPRVVGAPPGAPPPPLDPPNDAPGGDLTTQARAWLKSVPESARGRARDVAETLREIGGSTSVRTIGEMDLFLRLGLAWSIGEDADAWATFSAAANAALDALKRSGVTPQQYGRALIQIADGIGG